MTKTEFLQNCGLSEEEVRQRYPQTIDELCAMMDQPGVRFADLLTREDQDTVSRYLHWYDIGFARVAEVDGQPMWLTGEQDYLLDELPERQRYLVTLAWQNHLEGDASL